MQQEFLCHCHAHFDFPLIQTHDCFYLLYCFFSSFNFTKKHSTVLRVLCRQNNTYLYFFEYSTARTGSYMLCITFDITCQFFFRSFPTFFFLPSSSSLTRTSSLRSVILISTMSSSSINTNYTACCSFRRNVSNRGSSG